MDDRSRRATPAVPPTKVANRRRSGRVHALQVIKTVVPTDVFATDYLDARKVWIGADDRGMELEIVAVALQAELLVIHVMPTARRRKP